MAKLRKKENKLWKIDGKYEDRRKYLCSKGPTKLWLRFCKAQDYIHTCAMVSHQQYTFTHNDTPASITLIPPLPSLLMTVDTKNYRGTIILMTYLFILWVWGAFCAVFSRIPSNFRRFYTNFLQVCLMHTIFTEQPDMDSNTYMYCMT